MKVYGHPMSTCTRKVLTTLAEKGKEAEFVLVDLMKGEHKTPEHVARQPFGVIPFFDDDGFTLYESRAIIRYLDAKLPGTSLVPSDLRDRAKMEQWISVEQSYVSPGMMKVVMEVMFAPAMHGREPNQDVVAKGRAETEKALDVLNKGLAGKEFLAGSFSLAEITLMPYFEYFAAAGGADLIGARENVAAWWKRVSARPSWQKVTGKQSAAT